MNTLATPRIIDPIIDIVNETLELRYYYQGELIEKQFTDVQMIKQMKRSGLITSHQLKDEVMYVINGVERCELPTFVKCFMDIYKLIEYIEQC